MPESKGERSREALEEREKMGRKEERGPSNGNKLGPTRIESGFESHVTNNHLSSELSKLFYFLFHKRKKWKKLNG